MIPLKELFPGVGSVFQITGLLLMIAWIFIAIDAFYEKRRAAYRVFAVVQLAAGLLLFCSLMDGTFSVDYAPRQREYPFFVDVLYSMPWIAVAAIELLFIAAVAICIASIVRFRRTHLSRESIKETVDMLPAGICFSRPDGTVMLKNLRMDALCRELTGASLNDAVVFMQTLREQSAESEDTWFLVEKDGVTIQFTCDKTTLNGVTYDLLLASDLSEQYRITSELREKNKKLLDIRVRMRAFGEETAQLAMTEEILKARSTVHDEVGHILLSGKYYLENPDSADDEKLLQLARHTNYLLTREAEEPDDAMRDGYTEALDIARAIGVDVTVDGEPPADKGMREILGTAIRECAANTVKHADGDSLHVALTTDKNALTAVLAGNGSAPTAPITATGGLLMLRKRTQAAGGDLNISADPLVKLTIRLPIR